MFLFYFVRCFFCFLRLFLCDDSVDGLRLIVRVRSSRIVRIICFVFFWIFFASWYLLSCYFCSDIRRISSYNNERFYDILIYEIWILYLDVFVGVFCFGILIFCFRYFVLCGFFYVLWLVECSIFYIKCIDFLFEFGNCVGVNRILR